ncbi:MAG: SIS domain-containing protein [Candidatus Wallbacteria bacterium]|nr:SIS domain-containing protein [Candidatus Wallbacteria bacterium]
MTPREKADQYLALSHMFRLGEITTEKPHPKTMEMSKLANSNLPRAVSVLKELDLALFHVLRSKAEEIARLGNEIKDTFQSGGRVFLAGCGATGRLSLSLEYFWRMKGPVKLRESVFGMMAGGDSAIIKSIEKFEDHPEYAARQMLGLGFSKNDLMVAITEGGETPFVIGAAEEATRISSRKPYFLYCNPDKDLTPIERSRKVIENPGIVKINLSCGPMALSGSTRMQASTIQMAAAGLALFQGGDRKDLDAEISRMEKAVSETDFSFLSDFIELESATYRDKDYILYETNDYGITILTDSTERAPTFSLLPFENVLDKNPPPSLCYICYPDVDNSPSAWHRLFQRDPRPLNWDGRQELSTEYLMGFDFSKNIKKYREEKVKPSKLHLFGVKRQGDDLVFSFKGKEKKIRVAGLSILAEHTLLKLLLNTHSTLIMGRLDRYQDNFMIWVRPSNNKLIDRSIRYVRHLLSSKGIEPSYEETAYALFEEIETLSHNEPIVLKTVNRLLASNHQTREGAAS